MKAVIAVAVLALVLALVPSVSAAVLGPSTDCIICDTVQGAGPNECWIINDQSDPQATSARTFLWDNSIKNNTWYVEGICYLPHKSTSDYNLFLNNTALDFGYANLTLHFNRVNLTSSTLTASPGSCSGNKGFLKIVAEDFIYIDKDSEISNDCGDIILQAPNIFIEKNLRSIGSLTLKDFSTLIANSSSLVKASDVLTISSNRDGSGAEFYSRLQAATAGSPSCLQNNGAGLDINVPKQQLVINNTAAVLNCHAHIAAAQATINNIQVSLGALALEAGGLSISGGVNTKYSQNYVLTGPVEVAKTASLISASHWIAFNSNYTGATENVIAGSIMATNKRPDLPYASDYPGLLFKDSVFLYFPYGALTINSTISSFRGRDANDVGFVEDPAPNQAIGDLSKWTYTLPIPTYKDNLQPVNTYNFDTTSPAWQTSGGGIAYDGGIWYTDRLNNYSNSIGGSSVTIDLVNHWPIRAGITYHPNGVSTTRFEAVGARINVSAGLLGNCNKWFGDASSNNLLTVSISDSPSGPFETYNLSGYLQTNAAGPPVNGYCVFDDAVFLNSTKDPSDNYFKNLITGTRYYYALRACTSEDVSDPSKTGPCVETPLYSFVAGANPKPVGVALYNQNSYKDFSASAKIEFLEPDPEYNPGNYFAGMYFRANQAANGGKGGAYLLAVFPMQLADTINLSVGLFYCWGGANFSNITSTEYNPQNFEKQLCPNPVLVDPQNTIKILDAALVTDPASGKLKLPAPYDKGFRIKVEAEANDFKVYFTPSAQFSYQPLFTATDNNFPDAGFIGFLADKSSTRFSDFHVGLKPTDKARADIAVAANKLTLGQNANIGADYESIHPGPVTGGSVFLFGREMNLLDNNATGCDQIPSGNNACAQFPSTNPAYCKPYVYTNPCNSQSFFFKLGCSLTQSFDDNNTNYYARAPTTYKEEFCLSQAQLTLFGVVKTPAGAKVQSGSFFVEKVTDASGAPVISNLLNAPWSAAFGDSISNGDTFLLMGGAGTPALWLLPASTYYVHVWVSDCADDSFSFRGTTPCKRHKYVVKFEA